MLEHHKIQIEKRFGRTMQNKQLMNTDAKKRVKDLNSKFRSSTDNLISKQEENNYKSQMEREKLDD